MNEKRIDELMERLSDICDEFESAEAKNDWCKMDELKIEADEIRSIIDTEYF